MKKLTTLLASILLGGVIYATPMRIIFSMMSDDLTPVLPPHPKTPVDMPEACIDENIVTFKSQHDNYYLQLLDEDSSIVYSTYVPSSLTTVTLPSKIPSYMTIRNGGAVYMKKNADFVIPVGCTLEIEEGEICRPYNLNSTH